MSRDRTSLPIDDYLSGILQTLAGQNSLIVSASPGAGKTTRLPPEILKITDRQVWVLEPRRIAAIAAANRIAEENRWVLGREVGYQVRFDNKSSKETRLLFLTEALLMRKLLLDPELSQVGCIVLDEFHERSLHVDLALGALRELQELARPDLKIVVMSATLNSLPLSRFLGSAPVVEVPGRAFPNSILYEEKSQLLRVGPDFTERMRKLVVRALNENPAGDVLCFLPGRGEIESLREALSVTLKSELVFLFSLHGSLSLQEQKAALAPAVQGRKVVLATNVAESSLTVQGVRIVVDSGLARLSQLHPRTGFESLDLIRISKASAVQRAGRAARTAPGVVYRAWTTHDELSMKDFDLAEIFRADLSESLLLLSALGVTRFESFSWFEAPAGKSLSQGRSFLRAIGALNEDGTLTTSGREIQNFPLHPRLAKLLFIGRRSGRPQETADLCALLSERDSNAFSASSEMENDILARWEEWKRSSHHPRSANLNRTAEQLARWVDQNRSNLNQISNQSTPVKIQSGSSSHLTSSKEKHRNLQSSPAPLDLEKWLPEILLDAYADRLCRRRRPREPQAKMTGGRGVKLHPRSSVKASEYFVAIELSEGRDSAETLIFQAVGIPESLILQKIVPKTKSTSRVEWDDEKSCFFAIESKMWEGLAIGHEHIRPARPEEVADQLLEVILNRWNQVLAANQDLAAWLKRIEFLNRSVSTWPLLNDEDLRQVMEQACYQEHSLEAVKKKDLVSYFESYLSDDHRQALVRECPSHWTVPTGHRMRIQYTEEQGPMVEVRLQELFGLHAAPKIAGHQLTLVLLGPNYRPVQVTRDLPSFWKNGYPEVRKEMRTRYPKHSWPEDPLTALPQAKGRPRT